MVVSLLPVMQALVNKHVQHYQTDFKYDRDILLDKDVKTNVFYWYLRDCGTDLMQANRVYFENDWQRDEAIHWPKYVVKAYKITVENVGRKNVYGRIEPINIKCFEESLKNSLQKYCSVEAKIVLTDGKKEIIQITKEDEDKHGSKYAAICKKLKAEGRIMTVNEIKSWTLLGYTVA